MDTAVEVGRLAHQRRHVPRGGHVEEGSPIDVRRLHHTPAIVHGRYLVVADAVVLQEGVLVLERVRVLLVLGILLILW